MIRHSHIRAEAAGRKRQTKQRPKGAGPTFTCVRRLPDGMTVEQARQRCAEAIAEWLSEAAR